MTSDPTLPKTEPVLAKVPAARESHGMSDAEREAWEAKRQASKFRRLRRKAREEEGEIEDLNITPMLDMMTIILVFLLKSYNTGFAPTMSNELLPPQSTTTLEPSETTMINISKSAISVGDKLAVQLDNWEVPAAATNPAAPLIITPVLDLLKASVKQQKFIAQYNKGQPFEGLVSIVGDRDVPYKLIYSVLGTAGQAELSTYKFVVLKQGQ